MRVPPISEDTKAYRDEQLPVPLDSSERLDLPAQSQRSQNLPYPWS